MFMGHVPVISKKRRHCNREVPVVYKKLHSTRGGLRKTIDSQSVTVVYGIQNTMIIKELRVCGVLCKHT